MVPEAKPNFASGAVNWTHQKREVVDWSTGGFAFYDGFRKRPERQSLIDRLVLLTNAHPAKVGFVLDNGATFAAVLAGRRGLDRAVPRVRDYLEKSLVEGPRRVLILVDVIGVFVSRRFTLGTGVAIRPVRPADVTYQDLGFFGEGPLSRPVPQSMIEARVRFSPESPISIIPDWVVAFRLATGYPVVCPRQQSVPLEPSVGGMVSSMSTPIVQVERGPEIASEHIRLVRQVKILIEMRSPMQQPIATALDRLGRSIEQPIQWPMGLLFAVMGLEALFLEGQPEARRTLSTRTALLLGLTCGDPGLARDNVKLAYDLRSQFVHGAEFDSEGAQQIVYMHREMREYLRRSILLFLVRGAEKKEFLAELDRAAIDLASAARLQALIKKEISHRHLAQCFGPFASKVGGT